MEELYPSELLIVRIISTMDWILSLRWGEWGIVPVVNLEAETESAARLLQRAIRGAGHTQNEVERRIGLSKGYLSQLLTGKVDLKLKHVLRALEAVGIPPVAFYRELAAASPSAGEAGSESEEGGSGATGGEGEAGGGSGEDTRMPTTRPELDEIIHRVVREVLTEEKDQSSGSSG